MQAYLIDAVRGDDFKYQISDFKNGLKSFQRLEKRIEKFPMIGKTV